MIHHFIWMQLLIHAEGAKSVYLIFVRKSPLAFRKFRSAKAWVWWRVRRVWWRLQIALFRQGYQWSISQRNSNEKRNFQRNEKDKIKSAQFRILQQVIRNESRAFIDIWYTYNKFTITRAQSRARGMWSCVNWTELLTYRCCHGMYTPSRFYNMLRNIAVR